jgi:DNA polymerase alpha subunit B
VLFPTQVLRRLAQWQQEPANQSRRVLLMPAVRDVTAVPAFPQPPLEAAGLAGSQLRSVQNPCSFSVGGSGGEAGAAQQPQLSVAACSQDVLLHLTGSEVAQGGGADRMTALASHLLGQQR